MATPISVSEPCEADLRDMYDVNHMTYKTIYDPTLMSQMTTRIDAPFSANFHVFNGNMEALNTFANTCESYPASSRVTFFSFTNKCTHDFHIGIPACIPSSCYGHGDTEVAMALSDNPTPLFQGNDCSDIYWASEIMLNSNIASITPEKIKSSNSCMADLITVAGSAMAGASNVTAVTGLKAHGESCMSYYNGHDHGESTINGEFINVKFEMVCDEKVNRVMDGFFCMPSSCNDRQMVAAALNEITHAEDVNPYFAFLYFSWNWRANCKWVYRVPEEEEVEGLINDSNRTSLVNETIMNQSESSSSGSNHNIQDTSLLSLVGSVAVFTLMTFFYS